MNYEDRNEDGYTRPQLTRRIVLERWDTIFAEREREDALMEIAIRRSLAGKPEKGKGKTLAHR